MLRRRLVSYWSGSQSACLALHMAMEQSGAQLICLMTALSDTGETPCPYGPSQPLLRAQADALRTPLLVFNTMGDDSEKLWSDTTSYLKYKYDLDEIIFGHTEANEHKNWVEQISKVQGLEALFPLCEKNEEELFQSFVDAGYKAKIIAVNEKKLNRDFLGRDLDKDILGEFEARKISIWGTAGEYRTVVYDGPLFSTPLKLKQGEISLKNGYWKADYV
jgi:diphthine-ammonia ligase